MAVKEKLARQLKEIPPPSPTLPARGPLIRAAGSLDDDLLNALLAISGNPSAPAFLLIENCPLGDLPETPRTSRQQVDKDAVSENFLLMLGVLLGQPCGYRPETADALVMNLVPDAERRSTLSSAGYEEPLGYHVDLTHIGVHAPDIVATLCLRGDPAGEAVTYCIDARDAVAGLSSKAKAVMREPLYSIGLPDSCRGVAAGADWSPGEEATFSEPMPLLSGPDELPQISVEFNSMRAETPEAEAALRELKRVCGEPGLPNEVRLTSGTALIIRNRASLHARSAYRPEFSGDQRWIQRLYVTSDLWKSRGALAPNSCVLEGAFITQG